MVPFVSSACSASLTICSASSCVILFFKVAPLTGFAYYYTLLLRFVKPLDEINTDYLLTKRDSVIQCLSRTQMFSSFRLMHIILRLEICVKDIRSRAGNAELLRLMTYSGNGEVNIGCCGMAKAAGTLLTTTRRGTIQAFTL